MTKNYKYFLAVESEQIIDYCHIDDWQINQCAIKIYFTSRACSICPLELSGGIYLAYISS